MNHVVIRVYGDEFPSVTETLRPINAFVSSIFSFQVTSKLSVKSTVCCLKTINLQLTVA